MAHAPHGDGHGHGHGNDLEQALLPAKTKGDDHGHAHGGDDDHGHAHGGKKEGRPGGCNHAHGASEDHGHSHGGGGGGKSAEDIKALQTAVWLALFFMTVELFGGLYANSLAIMTDAAHMLSDVGGFIISLLGLRLAQMMATEEYTYGFKQAEVLGAFMSILIVWALTAVLLCQAIERFRNPEPIDAQMMSVIAVIGLIVNLVLMKVLGHNHSHAHGGSCGSDGDDSVAIKAAVAHVVGDIVQSIGVIIAAVLIWWQPIDIGHTPDGLTNWVYADPCCTMLFGVMVLWTTKATIVFSVDTLMVKAPEHINQATFLEKLAKIKNVVEIHDLHVWTMGSKEVLCTAHVQIKGATNQTKCLTECIQVAQSMGIMHSTFQIELAGEFDPATESYGGLSCGNAATPGGDDHGDGHAGHGGHDSGHAGHGDHGDAKDNGHAHDDGGCCGGHEGGGHDSGHGGHGGHDGGHDHGGHGH